jgi:hypothetical protein
MSLIQHWSAITAATVRLRALGTTTANSLGTKSERRVPLNHGSSQKSVEVLLPTSQQIEAAKNALVSASSFSGKDAQARPGSALCSQSQRRRRALPMKFKSRMPRSPRQIDLATPPGNHAFARKSLNTFTRAFYSHGGRWRLMAI